MRDGEAELAQDVVPFQDGGRVSKESSGSSTRISQHGDSFIQQEVTTTPLKPTCFRRVNWHDIGQFIVHQQAG